MNFLQKNVMMNFSKIKNWELFFINPGYASGQTYQTRYHAQAPYSLLRALASSFPKSKFSANTFVFEKTEKIQILPHFKYGMITKAKQIEEAYPLQVHTRACIFSCQLFFRFLEKRSLSFFKLQFMYFKK